MCCILWFYRCDLFLCKQNSSCPTHVQWLSPLCVQLPKLLSSRPTLWSEGTRDFPLIKPSHSGIQLNHMSRADKLSKNNVREAKLSGVKSKERCNNASCPPKERARSRPIYYTGLWFYISDRKKTYTMPDRDCFFIFIKSFKNTPINWFTQMGETHFCHFSWQTLKKKV